MLINHSRQFANSVLVNWGELFLLSKIFIHLEYEIGQYSNIKKFQYTILI